MAAFEMAPGQYFEEIAGIRKRLADVEGELERQKRHAHAGEEHFRVLADASPAMIWMAGPDALHYYFNPAWLEYRGRGLEQETGNRWTEDLHPEDRDLWVETYLKAFGARQPFHMQYRLRSASGDYAWIEIAGAPYFTGDGAFAGFIGSAADVTGRKRGFFTPDEESVRRVFSLTERERQVLLLIADGNSTKNTAIKLGISYKTADSHRSRILEKLNVHETASMVRYAIRAGLIAP